MDPTRALVSHQTFSARCTTSASNPWIVVQDTVSRTAGPGGGAICIEEVAICDGTPSSPAPPSAPIVSNRALSVSMPVSIPVTLSSPPPHSPISPESFALGSGRSCPSGFYTVRDEETCLRAVYGLSQTTVYKNLRFYNHGPDNTGVGCWAHGLPTQGMSGMPVAPVRFSSRYTSSPLPGLTALCTSSIRIQTRPALATMQPGSPPSPAPPPAIQLGLPAVCCEKVQVVASGRLDWLTGVWYSNSSFLGRPTLTRPSMADGAEEDWYDEFKLTSDACKGTPGVQGSESTPFVFEDENPTAFPNGLGVTAGPVFPGLKAISDVLEASLFNISFALAGTSYEALREEPENSIFLNAYAQQADLPRDVCHDPVLRAATYYSLLRAPFFGAEQDPYLGIEQYLAGHLFANCDAAILCPSDFAFLCESSVSPALGGAVVSMQCVA